jgi:AraC family transcriptional regulator
MPKPRAWGPESRVTRAATARNIKKWRTQPGYDGVSMPSTRDLLQVVRDIRHRRPAGSTLEELATRAGWSPFHLHRAFRAMVRETPKQYALRLQLQKAAAWLVSSDDSILDIAIAVGFNSHEVFTRAFRRQFAVTPAAYRARALIDATPETRTRHVTFLHTSGPCLGLFHVPTSSPRRVSMPTLSIERRDIAAQPFLFVRMRVARHELSSAIGEGLGKAFPYAMRTGIAIGGRPTTRYLSTGPGLYNVEIGMPVAAATHGEGDVEVGSLPGGPVAVAVHGGSYEQLSETYAALERWIEANGFRVNGAPWEAYITDPADFPDPADWRTEVYWPLQA